MRKFVVSLLMAGSALVTVWAALPAFASHVPPHQHFLVNPDGTRIPVGPDACKFGPSTAFDEFHFNIHFGTPNQEAFQQAGNPVSFIAPVPCP
jgi:hypothetical protein